MKPNLHLKKSALLASILGLTALLLFSPCKVRNAVQTALDVPLTEVSNKSVCQMYEELETVVLTTTTAQQTPAMANSQTELTFVPVDFKQLPVAKIEDKQASNTAIPYYILYQNLKIHL